MKIYISQHSSCDALHANHAKNLSIMFSIDSTMFLLNLLVVSDQSYNHAVQVKEKEDKVATKFNESLLFVSAERAEDLGRVQQMVVGVNLASVKGQQRSVDEE